ncbi:hypothetical protein [Polyangium sp. 15x6]|uniref:hypothetical protein n=1 Tax=Polyangium sp. 15x6 TaxID=3042687 RepID=UPI00249CE1D7|nr:hypothetical protein [Polyangium sp. 15x6]MDI3290132.1 hypothetical protein [Polyangium sp. 15x6]
MRNLDRLNDRQRVLLVAGAADLHPITAGHVLGGKPVSRKTRIALERARANLDAIREELGAALDRLAANDTATTAGAVSSASMPGGAAALA